MPVRAHSLVQGVLLARGCASPRPEKQKVRSKSLPKMSRSPSLPRQTNLKTSYSRNKQMKNGDVRMVKTKTGEKVQIKRVKGGVVIKGQMIPNASEMPNGKQGKKKDKKAAKKQAKKR